MIGKRGGIGKARGTIIISSDVERALRILPTIKGIGTIFHSKVFDYIQVYVLGGSLFDIDEVAGEIKERI